MKRFVLLFSLVLLLGTGSAFSAIDMTTLPPRDTVQLTIYNGEDITLVKESRHLSFKKGINRIQFSWSNTLIDPTSIRFAFKSHGDKVELLDTIYPPNRKETLIWHIDSQVNSREDGAVKVQITYFTSGISWAADYAAFLEEDHKTMGLDGYVKIINHSGEDYENAQFRLIVGRINLVEKIAALAQKGVMYRDLNGKDRALYGKGYANRVRRAEMAMEKAKKDGGQRAIVKEGLSEYFIFTIEGTDTVKHRWQKRLPSFSVKGLPVEVFYKLDDTKWNQTIHKLLRFKNNKHEVKKDEKTLGSEPLPDGVIKVFTRSKDNTLWYEASQYMKYAGIGQEIDVDLGPEDRMLVERKRLRLKKINVRLDIHGSVIGWRTQEFFQTKITNRLPLASRLEVYRTFPGKFKIIESTLDFYQDDHDTYYFSMNLKPDEKVTLRYQVDTKNGKNRKNNDW